MTTQKITLELTPEQAASLRWAARRAATVTPTNIRTSKAFKGLTAALSVLDEVSLPDLDIPIPGVKKR